MLACTLVNVELCARADSIGPALANDSICLHVSKLQMTRGEFSDIRIVFSAGNNKSAIRTMHDAIKMKMTDGARLESSSLEERIIAHLNEKTVVG